MMVETPFGGTADNTPPFEDDDPMGSYVGLFTISYDLGFGRTSGRDYATRDEAERAVEGIIERNPTAGCSRHYITINRWIRRHTDGRVTLAPVASWWFGKQITEGWNHLA